MKFLLILLFSPLAFGVSITGIEKNNEAVEKLKEEKNYEAYKLLLEALAEEPFSAEVKLNLGFVFELNEENDKALKEYKAVLRGVEPGEAKFYALFNAAQVEAKLKNIDQALKYYQQALDIRPDSLEVKTNIELLTSQQQGGGGGEGDEKKDQDKSDGQGDQKQQDPKDGQKKDKKKKKQPKEFKSKKLTKDDVRKILEELKNQEQKIRAKEFNKGGKEKPNDKDW